MYKQAESALEDGARGKARLVCLFLPGCVPCAGVLPLAELLASHSVEVEFIDCYEDYGALERFGGQGTPYWCLAAGDEVIASLYPADNPDPSALYDFVTRIDADLTRESFDDALSEGRRKAEFLEACQAELALRSPESDATELMGAARLKIAKPCLSLADGEDVRACIERSAERLEGRLQERIAMPGGDTPARREVIERLPALIDELSLEVADILRDTRQGDARQGDARQEKAEG